MLIINNKKSLDYKYLFYKKDNLINKHNDNYIVSYKLKNKKNKIARRYVYENISKYHIFIIEYLPIVIKVKNLFRNNIIFILNKYELTYNGKFIYSLFNDS